jgi:prophage regulatory protein
MQESSRVTFLRRRQVEIESGCSRSTLYQRISQGLWPKPVRIGPRAVAWPATEVAAVNAARLSGLSDEAICLLVAGLHDARHKWAGGAVSALAAAR